MTLVALKQNNQTTMAQLNLLDVQYLLKQTSVVVFGFEPLLVKSHIAMRAIESKEDKGLNHKIRKSTVAFFHGQWGRLIGDIQASHWKDIVESQLVVLQSCLAQSCQSLHLAKEAYLKKASADNLIQVQREAVLLQRVQQNSRQALSACIALIDMENSHKNERRYITLLDFSVRCNAANEKLLSSLDDVAQYQACRQQYQIPPQDLSSFMHTIDLRYQHYLDINGSAGQSWLNFYNRGWQQERTYAEICLIQNVDALILDNSPFEEAREDAIRGRILRVIRDRIQAQEWGGRDDPLVLLIDQALRHCHYSPEVPEQPFDIIEFCDSHHMAMPEELRKQYSKQQSHDTLENEGLGCNIL